MSQIEIGWIAVAFGALYAIALAAFPRQFDNWLLCPRWGLFGPPASRLAGIGGGLAVVGLGLVHLNTVFSAAPVWAPWLVTTLGAIVLIKGGNQPPLYKVQP